MTSLSEKLKENSEKTVDLAENIIVQALAGTGKTTTLIEAVKMLLTDEQSELTPSDQQEEVWSAIIKGGQPRSIGFVAFGKDIADELKTKVPKGCDAMTTHSMGFKAVMKQYGKLKVNNFRVSNIICDILKKDIRQLKKEKQELLTATTKLVSLCKMLLIGWKQDINWSTKLSGVASYFDVDLNDSTEQVFDLVPKVLECCKDVSADKEIDFDDMVWLPLVLDLPVYQYDLLLVDEGQDLNKSRQRLCLKAGRRIVLVGDSNQAIFGFTGADSKSMSTMTDILEHREEGCISLPLTVTRRCGKNIVKEAQKIVPEFTAHEDNPEGVVSQHLFKCDIGGRTYHQEVVDGDMILCRVNAPLVSECFRFIKEGKKANILGRDVATGLISTVKKMKADSIEGLIAALENWGEKERRKENAKKNPSDTKLIAIDDRVNCILCFCDDEKSFCDDAKSVENVINNIEKIFVKNKSEKGITLSSIHKAKGAESNRVFLLQIEGSCVPHPLAKSNWQKEQERNLLYVAITRAITELIYVY